MTHIHTLDKSLLAKVDLSPEVFRCARDGGQQPNEPDWELKLLNKVAVIDQFDGPVLGLRVQHVERLPKRHIAHSKEHISLDWVLN